MNCCLVHVKIYVYSLYSEMLIYHPNASLKYFYKMDIIHNICAFDYVGFFQTITDSMPFIIKPKFTNDLMF